MDIATTAATAVGLCRPGFASAFAAAPDARLAATLRDALASGAVAGCEFIDAASDSAALGLAMQASARGIRSYAATATENSLFMAEAAYAAGDRGLPVVMTIADGGQCTRSGEARARVESTVLRDSGWIQLYPEDAQEALDLHIQAFRLAEALSCPVMIDVDGFMLGRAPEGLSTPSQARVDAFLPPFERPVMEQFDIGPANTASEIGATLENRYIQHHKQLRALDLIEALAQDFKSQFGRASGGLVRTHSCEDAETIVVSIGSLVSPIRDVVDELRQEGHRIGLLAICSFRPFPLRQIRDALDRASRVVVIERWLAVGMGGILSDGVRKAACGTDLGTQTVICGLDGRPIEKQAVFDVLRRACRDELEHLTFLGLDWDVVNRQLEQQRLQRRARTAAARTLRAFRTARALDRANG